MFIIYYFFIKEMNYYYRSIPLYLPKKHIRLYFLLNYRDEFCLFYYRPSVTITTFTVNNTV